MNAPLNQEVALRIALAIRQLEYVDTQELLQLLIGIMGEPITISKLSSLRARTLKNAGQELFGQKLFEKVDQIRFDKAFALLKGRGIQKFIGPKLPLRAKSKIDTKHISAQVDNHAGMLKVAFCSNSHENIDGNFVDCIRYLIYSVSYDHYQLIDVREPTKEPNSLRRSTMRASLVEDCTLLYAVTIGAAAAAKLVKASVHPIQVRQSKTASAMIVKLQTVLAKANPPPWIAKALERAAYSNTTRSEIKDTPEF